MTETYRTSSPYLMDYSPGFPIRPQTSAYIQSLSDQAARHLIQYLKDSQNGHPAVLDAQTGIPHDLLIYRVLQILIMEARRDLIGEASTRSNTPLDSPARLQ